MTPEDARLVIADHLGVDIAVVTDDAHLAKDLGADSLDLIELAMRFEVALDITIEDTETEACASVQDALDLIGRKMALRDAA